MDDGLLIVGFDQAERLGRTEAPFSGPHRLHQRPGAEDVEHPLQIVGENVEAHLRSNLSRVLMIKWVAPIQALSVPKVCSTGGAADTHGVGLTVEPILHGVDHRFMFPSLDAERFAGRALGFQRAVGALGRPVARRYAALRQGALTASKSVRAGSRRAKRPARTTSR
jgi:hypothetical protein